MRTSWRVSVRVSPCLVLELGVEQLGHEVVGGVLGAPVDVVLEHARRWRRSPAWTAIGSPGTVRRLASVLFADGDLVLLGDAEQHADDPHRQLGGELGDDVEAVGADQRVEAADAVLADLVFERRHPPRGEHPRHEAAVHRVHRRVLEEDHARRQLDAGLDDVEDVAAGAGERPAS